MKPNILTIIIIVTYLSAITCEQCLSREIKEFKTDLLCTLAEVAEMNSHAYNHLCSERIGHGEVFTAFNVVSFGIAGQIKNVIVDSPRLAKLIRRGRKMVDDVKKMVAMDESQLKKLEEIFSSSSLDNALLSQFLDYLDDDYDWKLKYLNDEPTQMEEMKVRENKETEMLIKPIASIFLILIWFTCLLVFIKIVIKFPQLPLFVIGSTFWFFNQLTNENQT